MFTLTEQGPKGDKGDKGERGRRGRRGKRGIQCRPLNGYEPIPLLFYTVIVAELMLLIVLQGWHF